MAWRKERIGNTRSTKTSQTRASSVWAFLYDRYDAVASLTSASRRHFRCGWQVLNFNNTNQSEVGTRSGPRIAQQSRKRQGTADGARSNLTALAFFFASDGLFTPTQKLNWRKLFDSEIHSFRRDGCRGRSPLPQSSRPRRPRTSPHQISASIYAFRLETV